MLAGFKSRLRLHKWVEFVVGSLRSSTRFFSWPSGFASPEKPTLLNSNLFIPVLGGKQIRVELRPTDTCLRTHTVFLVPGKESPYIFSYILYHIYHIILCNTVTAIYPEVYLCANDNHLSHKRNKKNLADR